MLRLPLRISQRPQAFSACEPRFLGRHCQRALLIAIVLACVVGCSPSDSNGEAESIGGDSSSDPVKEVEGDSNAVLEYVRKPTILPCDENAKLRSIKPGHWVSSLQHVRANKSDEYADVSSHVVDSTQQPILIPRTNYSVSSEQPTAFAQGEVTTIETEFFMPRRSDEGSQQSWLSTRLLSRDGSELLSTSEPTTKMPASQYYFVVLARYHTEYAYLNQLDAIAVSDNPFGAGPASRQYRVVLPDLTDGSLPLPSNALAWTSIAYLLWDGIDPSQLTRAQQTALLDWVHWGGQLIISGPDSLELLRDSFLDPILPAKREGVAQLAGDQLLALNRFWNVGSTVQRQSRAFNVSDEEPLLGVALSPTDAAGFVRTTGRLIAERQVGRGRTVVTAFSLSDRAVKTWSNLGTFFNGCLMRRPPREFRRPLGSVVPSFVWSDFPGLHEVPLLTSTVRYFARDLPTTHFVGRKSSALGAESSERSRLQETENTSPQEVYQTAGVQGDAWHFGGYGFDAQAGVAGWSDESGVLQAARRSLTSASGIEPPSSRFVFAALCAYLVVLVPINWCVFRLIGRVELAWLATPVIAVVGTVFVVRFAQLDIGFVRSRTEVSVMEIHEGYDRAHLSRFTALYSSLSTSYDVTCRDPSTFSLPLARSHPSQQSELEKLVVRQERSRIVQGFQVSSNSVGMLHSEQMYPLLGPLRVDRSDLGNRSLVNGTGLTMQDAGVIWRDEGVLKFAWLGDLSPDSVESLEFQTLESNVPWLSQWDDSGVTQSSRRRAKTLIDNLDANRDDQLDRAELAEHPELLKYFDRAQQGSRRVDSDGQTTPGLNLSELTTCCEKARAGEINLGSFFDLAIEQLQLGRGEMRMLAWTEEPLAGVEISPAATQRAQPCFIIAHLQPPQLVPPRPDANHVSDVADDERR